MYQPSTPELTPKQSAYLACLVITPQDLRDIKLELASSIWHSKLILAFIIAIQIPFILLPELWCQQVDFRLLIRPILIVLFGLIYPKGRFS